MKYIKVRIAVGTSDSTFDIFYDSPNGVGSALLFDTGLDAIDIPYEALQIGEGLTVSVPDDATSIILDSSPSAFCTTNTSVNDAMITIPLGCITYTVSSSAGIFNYYYTNCDCVNVSATIDATYGYVEQTFCALQDTVDAGLLTIVDNGYCSTPIPPNSVVFSGDELPAYGGAASGGFTEYNGTVEIIGDPVTFRGYVYIPDEEGFAATGLNIGGNGGQSVYIELESPNFDVAYSPMTWEFPAGTYTWQLIFTWNGLAGSMGEGGIDWVQS
jgi:hypothetical protein